MQAFLSAGTAVIISRELPAETAMSAAPIIGKGNNMCYSHFIKREVLDSIVINEIQRQANLALKESDKDELLKAADRRKEINRRCEEADQRDRAPAERNWQEFRDIRRKPTKIMWMVFWIKKNIFLIKRNMRSRIRISGRKFHRQRRRKITLKKQRKAMKTD